MRISTKGRYALRAMVDLASRLGQNSTVKQLSARQGIPVKYLEQILSLLTKAGLVKSMRGANGGYCLSRKPDEITVFQVLQATEGDLTPVACIADAENQCVRYATCPTVTFWKGLYDVVCTYVDQAKLSDFLNISPENES